MIDHSAVRRRALEGAEGRGGVVSGLSDSASSWLWSTEHIFLLLYLLINNIFQLLFDVEQLLCLHPKLPFVLFDGVVLEEMNGILL